MKWIYHHRIASRDGQFVHLQAILDELKRQGDSVVLVGPSMARPGAQTAGTKGHWVSLLRSKLPRSLCEVLEFVYNFWSSMRLFLAVVRHRPQIIYERYNLFSPAGVWIAGLFRIPLLLEVNAPLALERTQHGGLSLLRLARWSEVYTWRKATLVLPVTEQLALHVISAGVPRSRIQVIRNGIARTPMLTATRSQWIRQQLGLEDKTVIGFVGYVRQWHRLERIVDYLAQETGQQVHFLVVGEGPALDSVVQRAAELGVAHRISCVGSVSRDHMQQYLDAMDIAVQPDVVPYASPLKLIEYMARGLAIIAPDTDNIREHVVPGQEALLFKNDEMLSDHLQALISDPVARAQLGTAARDAVGKRQMLWSANAERIRAIAAAITTRRKTADLVAQGDKCEKS